MEEKKNKPEINLGKEANVLREMGYEVYFTDHEYCDYYTIGTGLFDNDNYHNIKERCLMIYDPKAGKYAAIFYLEKKKVFIPDNANENYPRIGSTYTFERCFRYTPKFYITIGKMLEKMGW